VTIISPLDEIPVVCEYPDVFPDELPGMPPDRDVEFVIELQLVLGTKYREPKPNRKIPRTEPKNTEPKKIGSCSVLSS
jgi:hypothetical protein